ncbi:plasma kallikrein-like [Alosa sapidissima]|uniref:plasma kallikrein-like n=1 Tax=Alosa sapidissima TaxID=34773 RepID=UPI001C090B8F|nr:plasma kallikrein-like [Alosa sapidissima]
MIYVYIICLYVFLYLHDVCVCVCVECIPDLRVNVDFPGSDVLQIFSPDVLHCQRACSQHHSCQFFTFIRPEWTRDSRQFCCYLKHTESGAPSRVTELEGVTSGYSLKNCNGTNGGPSLLPLHLSNCCINKCKTKRDCQRACTSDPGCQFFSWLNDDFARPHYKYKCHLKFCWSVSKPPALKVLSGVVSGFSQKFFQNNSRSDGQILLPLAAEQCEAQILTNTDFPRHDFEQIPAVSAEHCQFLCSAHPKCTYFSYEKQKMRCFLKDSKEEKPMKAKGEVYSGMPSRFCELPRGVCMHMACRRRCFLKQVITMPVPSKVASLKGVVSGFSLRGCRDPKPEETMVAVEKVWINMHMYILPLKYSHLHFYICMRIN